MWSNAWWVLWGIITLLMTAMALALPCLYLMTPKGLHIIHTFGLIRRFIPWDSVAGVEGAETIPPIVKPMHLLRVPHKTVYVGRLRDYPLIRRGRVVTATV